MRHAAIAVFAALIGGCATDPIATSESAPVPESRIIAHGVGLPSGARTPFLRRLSQVAQDRYMRYRIAHARIGLGG